MVTLTIGQVAAKAGVGVETIRFYERKGLIEAPPRKKSGYRQYDEDAVKRLAFIQQAKSLGFSLNEIHELFNICSRPGTSSRDIKNLSEAKLNDIESKIKMLQQIRRTLKSLIKKCPGEGSIGQCPILKAMDSDFTTINKVF